MPWEVSCIVVVASDEKVREETSNAELLKEPISLSFGAQQLVNEESRGDDCKRTEDTILNERIARTHGFPWAMMLPTPPNAEPMRSARPEPIINWPMQPQTFCTMCITPGREISLSNACGSFHLICIASMYNCISGDKWMYVMPRSVSDCIIYITDVRTVSGWSGGALISGPNRYIYIIYIIHMVLNKFNQIVVKNDLHVGSKCWTWPWITKQISDMSSSAQLCMEKLYRTWLTTYWLIR